MKPTISHCQICYYVVFFLYSYEIFFNIILVNYQIDFNIVLHIMNFYIYFE